MEMTNEKTDSPVYFCVDVVDGVAYYCRLWCGCEGRPIRIWDEIYDTLSILSELSEISEMEGCSDEMHFKEALENVVYLLDNHIDWGIARYREALPLLRKIKNGDLSKEVIDDLTYIVYERLHEKIMKRQEKKFYCIWKKHNFNPADGHGFIDIVDIIEAAEALRMVEEFGFCFGWDADLIEHKILRLKENEGVKDIEGAMRLVKAIREGIEDKEEAKRVVDKLLHFIATAT